MKECILLVGPPGSGKSTLAEVKEINSTLRNDDRPSYARVSQDDHGKEGHMSLFLKSIADGQNVIVDRMNFSMEQRARYLQVAKSNGYATRIVVLQVPMETCFKRMKSRFEKAFGQEWPHPTIRDEKSAWSALHTFFTKYERPIPDEADVIEFRGHERASVECIIVDLDGTLCNTDHRQHFMDQKPKDWKSFFGGVPNDPPHEWCRQLVGAMHSAQYQIVFASGRPEDMTRRQTEDWLTKTLPGLQDHDLFMRQRGDFRRDDVVKEIILDFEILPRYRPLFAVDDRQQVVDMWRRRGITCLQCAPGNF